MIQQMMARVPPSRYPPWAPGHFSEPNFLPHTHAGPETSPGRLFFGGNVDLVKGGDQGREDDPLGPARGVFFAGLLSVAFWLAVLASYLFF
jgi:hypothetical protein